MTVITPRLRLERKLLREFSYVIACDEVGRGALAGPVAVGATVIDLKDARRRVPEGLRDSKLVPELRRAAVADRARNWVTGAAVGWSAASEIDQVGIMRSLGLAAVRAIDTLVASGLVLDNAVVLLDGNYDYISVVRSGMHVMPVIKADRDCASAAAASVIAKVARDAVMVDAHEQAPHYEWARNKGYASATHRAAIRTHGLDPLHRASWAIADAPTLF